MLWFLSLLLLYSFQSYAQPHFDISTLINRTGTALPTQIGTGGNARSAALYQNRWVIVPSREVTTNVWVWDSQNPDAPPFSLPMGTGILAVQTFPINYVRTVGDDIFVSSLTTNPQGTGWGAGPFRLYRWRSLTSEPELVLSYTALAGRLGDAFSIIGDPNTNGKLIAHINLAPGIEFRVWNFENGVITNPDTPALITISPEAVFNNHGIFNPIPGEPDLFLVTSNNSGIIIANSTGVIQAEIPTTVINAAAYDPNIFYFGGRRYLTYTINSTLPVGAPAGARYQIVDITEGATVVEAINAITSTAILNERTVHDFVIGPRHASLTATNSVGVLENGNIRILAHVVGTGFVVQELRPEGAPPTARVQLIHNSADLALDTIDVYLNGVMLFDSIPFRTASPFLTLPAGVDHNISVTPLGAPIAAGVTQTVNLIENRTYIIVGSGNLSPTGYTPAEPFRLFVNDRGREAAANPANIDLLVFHGATDAPPVSIWETGVGSRRLIENIGFGQFSQYLPLEPKNNVIEVRDLAGTVVAAYELPLEGGNGVAATLVASGFLNPAVNSNGPEFGLFVAVPEGGPLFPLPVYEPTINTFPYVQDFETGTFNNTGWVVYNPDASVFEWRVTNLANNTTPGTYSAFHRQNAAAREVGWLVTPAIIIPPGADLELTFWSRNQFPASYGKNSVRVSRGSQNPADNNYVEIWTTSAVEDSWRANTVSLAEFNNDTIYLAFVYEGEDAHVWFLDDVRIGQRVIPPTYTVTFDVKNAAGIPIPDAVITLGAITNPAGNYVFTGLAPGTFAYRVTKIGYFDATGNVTVVDQNLTVPITLQPDVTAIPVREGADFQLFPNPARSVLNVVSPEMISEIRIIDILGQVVYSANVVGDRHQINVAGMRDGIYFVQMVTPQGIITRRVQIKQ